MDDRSQVQSDPGFKGRPWGRSAGKSVGRYLQHLHADSLTHRTFGMPFLIAMPAQGEDKEQNQPSPEGRVAAQDWLFV